MWSLCNVVLGWQHYIVCTVYTVVVLYVYNIIRSLFYDSRYILFILYPKNSFARQYSYVNTFIILFFVVVVVYNTLIYVYLNDMINTR